MPSSPCPPTAGAPPTGAAPALVCTSPWERHPDKEAGFFAAVAQESRPRLPWEENSTLHREAKALEHEEKVNKYQAVLVACVKAKYFSRKAFDKGGKFICGSNKILPGESLTAGYSTKDNLPSLANQASSKK